MSQQPLAGKMALVTGAGQGIGRAIAIALAEAGAKVAVNSATEKNCSAVADAIRAAGGEAIAIAGDVADSAFCQKMVDDTIAQLGGLHILINNAGVTRDGLLMRMKDEDWERVIDTNLKSAFLLTRAAARPLMKNRWGRIVNITSIVGIIGNPGQANYCASKAGMIGLTKSVAKELASRNITVNAIAPGFIRTRMTDELNDEQKNALLGQIPAGRFGEPEDIAGMTVFLCTEAAAYITGQVIEVTGGLGM
jgi:3-oxoacyl-[acyl-carrier protein] reductase